jgi:hypothetical protein
MIVESRLIKKLTLTISILFLTVIFTPLFAQASGLETASNIAKISESNPYQALVWALGSMCVVCMSGMAYVYNQNINNIKQQFEVLEDLSTNIDRQTEAINKSHEVLKDSVDKINDRPCMFGSDIIKDLIKK